MEKTKEIQRRAERAMKRAVRQGIDPRNSTETQGKVYKRLCIEDLRRKPHVHVFDWDGSQTCECGARFD